MRRIENIEQLTHNRFLNLYEMDMHNADTGKRSKYYVASRAKSAEELKIKTRKNKADGVIIYSVYQDGDDDEKIVLIRQYRVPIDDYIYEFPAGLVDEGEDFHEAGIRELKEETGLDLKPIKGKDMYTRPYFTTIGMTDESCGTVYGYAYGTPSKAGQEENEEIEIVLADRKEVQRILEEENVSIMCAYMLIHFLNTPKGHVFDFVTRN